MHLYCYSPDDLNNLELIPGFYTQVTSYSNGVPVVDTDLTKKSLHAALNDWVFVCDRLSITLDADGCQRWGDPICTIPSPAQYYQIPFNKFSLYSTKNSKFNIAHNASFNWDTQTSTVFKMSESNILNISGEGYYHRDTNVKVNLVAANFADPETKDTNLHLGDPKKCENRVPTIYVQMAFDSAAISLNCHTYSSSIIRSSFFTGGADGSGGYEVFFDCNARQPHNVKIWDVCINTLKIFYKIRNKRTNKTFIFNGTNGTCLGQLKSDGTIDSSKTLKIKIIQEITGSLPSTSCPQEPITSADQLICQQLYCSNGDEVGGYRPPGYL